MDAEATRLLGDLADLVRDLVAAGRDLAATAADLRQNAGWYVAAAGAAAGFVAGVVFVALTRLLGTNPHE